MGQELYYKDEIDEITFLEEEVTLNLILKTNAIFFKENGCGIQLN